MLRVSLGFGSVLEFSEEQQSETGSPVGTGAFPTWGESCCVRPVCLELWTVPCEEECVILGRAGGITSSQPAGPVLGEAGGEETCPAGFRF